MEPNLILLSLPVVICHFVNIQKYLKNFKWFKYPERAYRLELQLTWTTEMNEEKAALEQD